MNFISFAFAGFFAVLLLILKLLPDRNAQQWVLLGASYIFYALWDWRFLALLFGLSASVWWLGKAVGERRSKPALVLGVSLCVGVLGIFKYLGFFLKSFCSLLKLDDPSIHLILPLGLSFYIFQAISYLYDAYTGKIIPTTLRNVLIYIGFFPQIVSGPIVKAHDFLPQLEEAHRITSDNLSYGLQLFCVGMFKKVVIADRLGEAVNAVFEAPAAYSGLSLAVTVFAYTIQLYCDFSGYSDMAVGVARCMDYDLGCNFNMPFLARNPSELWSRWHISLSSWFRDYVYIPLGGSRRGESKACRNLIITMLLSGIWHGANWTFVLWGLLHGLASGVHRLFLIWRRKRPKPAQSIIRQKLVGTVSAAATFLLFSALLLPFRAVSIAEAWMILHRIITCAPGVSYISVFTVIYGGMILGIHLIAGLFNGGNSLFRPLDLRRFSSKVIFLVFLLLTFLFACTGNTSFLYAQF